MPKRCNVLLELVKELPPLQVLEKNGDGLCHDRAVSTQNLWARVGSQRTPLFGVPSLVSSLQAASKCSLRKNRQWIVLSYFAGRRPASLVKNRKALREVPMANCSDGFPGTFGGSQREERITRRLFSSVRIRSSWPSLPVRPDRCSLRLTLKGRFPGPVLFCLPGIPREISRHCVHQTAFLAKQTSSYLQWDKNSRTVGRRSLNKCKAFPRVS